MSRPPLADAREAVFTSGIRQIGRQAWNGLAGVANPFTRYEFLEALESSRCVSASSGWQPAHLMITEAGKGSRPVAVMPLYAKDNSYGEYVFDFSWADAYRTGGLDYYPKFVTSVPFTPSVGERLFIGDSDSETITRLVADQVERRAGLDCVSSWHVLFPVEGESLRLQQEGLARRKGCQFQWFNASYRDFDAFLAELNSRKRKNIRKERQAVVDSGTRFEWLEGAEISEEHWRLFFTFYENTYLVRGRYAYLSLDFFLRIGESMPENLKLLLTYDGHRCIAGALFFTGGQTLYGRYWGSLEDYRFLHFETCYYQGIDYCIRHNLKRFDSGAQGEHKIQRGFRPVVTYSNHWIGHPEYARAIGDFLEREARYIDQYTQEAAKLLPFKAAG
ncbi:MAG: GNAT family N-acetyltransferase [Pseudohongiellaceae bacterium]